MIAFFSNPYVQAAVMAGLLSGVFVTFLNAWLQRKAFRAQQDFLREIERKRIGELDELNSIKELNDRLYQAERAVERLASVLKVGNQDVVGPITEALQSVSAFFVFAKQFESRLDADSSTKSKMKNVETELAKFFVAIRFDMPPGASTELLNRKESFISEKCKLCGHLAERYKTLTCRSPSP